MLKTDFDEYLGSTTQLLYMSAESRQEPAIRNLEVNQVRISHDPIRGVVVIAIAGVG